MKILVAEDDQNILEGIVEVLEDEGYQAIKASNGKIALEQYQATSPDFIILDIMMPLLNGYDVCKEIRRQDTEIPIMFLSAKSEEIDKVIGLELGADDYLSKPFGIKELLARIRAIRRRFQQRQPQKQKVQSSSSFQMGGLEVFPEELRAKRNEEIIDLSQRDIKILQTLHQNQGKVLDRDTLFNQCWGMNYFPSSRTLDQHISQLRKKVEENPKEPQLIKTVHGIGYRYDKC